MADRLAAYKGVVFRGLPRTVGTRHIEHFNVTLRLGLPRMVRESLPFSRKRTNLGTLLGLFLHRHNAS